MKHRDRLALDALRTCEMVEGVTGWEYLYNIQKVQDAIEALEAAQSQPMSEKLSQKSFAEHLAERSAAQHGVTFSAQPVDVPAGWVMEQDIIHNKNVAETLARAGEKIVQITAAAPSLPVPLPVDEKVQPKLDVIVANLMRHAGFTKQFAKEIAELCLSSAPAVDVELPVVAWPPEPTHDMQLAGANAIRFDTTILNKIWTANAVYRAIREVVLSDAQAAIAAARSPAR